MRIGVLEDDTTRTELCKLWLPTTHHQCAFHASVADFIAALSIEKFDLLLIDMSLPDGNGAEVVSWVRKNLGWHLPIIVVTAGDTESDIVNTLPPGADDYVLPPRHFELIARIEALGRRIKSQQQWVLMLGSYQIDHDKREIILNGRPVVLTQKESQVARYLFLNQGRLLSRVHMLEAIWGLQAAIDTRTVDTHVSRLRRELNIYRQNGWQIISIYGYGYGYGYRMETMDKA